MVASPRNHLYRTPIGTNFPAFRFHWKARPCWRSPHEFDRKAALSGTDGDTLDKTAQDLDRLRSGLRIRESLLETTDFLSIDCVGMKSRSRRWRTRNLRLELELMLLKLVEFHLKARSPKAFSYCLDQAMQNLSRSSVNKVDLCVRHL
jgi:hypothetical protein